MLSINGCAVKGDKMSELRQVYVVNGQQFDTKAEAQDFLRRPKIRTALLAVTANKVDLADWLLENQEAVEQAFETGTIRRVTKSERKKLEKACEALKEFAHEPKIAFLVENADVIAKSFRWPSVERMTDEAKAVAARNSLVAASEGNEELANWIIENKEAVLAAYEAGVEKRQISNKATEALAAYRAKKAQEKAAAERAAG